MALTQQDIQYINSLIKKSNRSKGIVFFTNFLSFPVLGTQNLLYIDKTARVAYIWTGSIYQTV